METERVQQRSTCHSRALVLAGLLLGTAGCATAPKARPQPYLVAVRYDVEPMFVGRDPGDALDAMRGDFQTMAQLGFPTVYLKHVDDRDRPALLELARFAGVTLALPERRLGYFARTGVLPPGCRDVRELVRAASRERMREPALDALVVESGQSPRLAERAGLLVSALNDLGIPCISSDGPVCGTGSKPAIGQAKSLSHMLVTVDVAEAASDREGSLVQAYLARFHAGLIGGRTAGLLVDRFRRPAGDPPGLFVGPVSSRPRDRLEAGPTGWSPAQAAAIKRLLTRARTWGPKLCRLAAQPITDATGDCGHVELAAFVSGPRRYVLVFNPSGAQYARGSVQLPETIGGAPAIRAVEVPPSASLATGRVHGALLGRIHLRVALRPGDAALFEVF